MKKLLSAIYYLSVIIPIIILYVNIDSYLLTSTQSLIEYLKDFAQSIIDGDSKQSTDFKRLFVMGVLVMVGFKITSNFIQDRKLGLSLKERKGDWWITIWQLSISAILWIGLFKSATFLNVNTGAWLESFNAIMIIVVIGFIAKIYLTYLYFINNLGVKK